MEQLEKLPAVPAKPKLPESDTGEAGPEPETTTPVAAGTENQPATAEETPSPIEYADDVLNDPEVTESNEITDTEASETGETAQTPGEGEKPGLLEGLKKFFGIGKKEEPKKDDK